MSDQPRRRLRAAPAPRRVGEPNVLSNQAIPNRLSTAGEPARAAAQPPIPVRTAPVPSISSMPAARPAIGSPTQPADEAPRRARRLPSLGNLLFLGFVVFWALRLFANTSSSGAADPTTAPAPGGATTAGIVTFGAARGDDCGLEDEADTFTLSDDVWWRAELTAPQAEQVTVIVRSYRDDHQIERYSIPPEEGSGEWSVLCAGDPIDGYQAGSYRLEIWDAPEDALLAVGTYVKRPALP